MIPSRSALFLPRNLHNFRFHQDWRKGTEFLTNVYAVPAAINFSLANLHLFLSEPLQSGKQLWKTVLVRMLLKRGESIVLWCIHLITFYDDESSWIQSYFLFTYHCLSISIRFLLVSKLRIIFLMIMYKKVGILKI